ncbi:MAG: heme o synthase [Trueperaceae bacterium]|nr:heme o synthase [Truepera sp.]HRN17900.1 heme o synthase [Trueperaceae bacterium]HRQ09422.1 heme o synthase [Trueperaceae bacterium]
MNEADTPATGPARATVRDYLILTKPKVISLLLLTTVGAMFIAAKGMPDWLALLGILVGGYMSAGAAGVYNMVYDADIDVNMKRTAKRPLVRGSVTPRNALVFAVALTVLSFVIIALTSNMLAALLSWAGIAFYVLIYTMWLKRSTWQNIVIGGAAGSIPPLVGWAAVTNDLSLLAWILFAVVFVWTPVHFWALALMVKKDYANVGVPMAPSVIGERATVMQMIFYTVLTVVLTLLPFFLREFSPAYLVAALLLNVVLVVRMARVFLVVRSGRSVERQTALPLYLYSMSYLALVFLAMALDRVIF